MFEPTRACETPSPCHWRRVRSFGCVTANSGPGMKATSIIWRRTFPDSAPGTDGVAIFEGRVIGRVRHLTDLPRDPKPWSWSVTDPDLAGRPGWANTSGEMPSRRQAMARLIERWQEPAPHRIVVCAGGA